MSYVQMQLTIQCLPAATKANIASHLAQTLAALHASQTWFLLAGIGELKQLDDLFASCLQMCLQAARQVTYTLYAAEQAMATLLVSQPYTLLATSMLSR